MVIINNLIKKIKRCWRIETILTVSLSALVFGIFVPEFIMESQVSYIQRHNALVQSINNQIDLFKANHGYAPKEMRRNAWKVKQSPLGIQYYFPTGIPRYCPNGSPWLIDSSTKYLVPHNH